MSQKREPTVEDLVQVRDQLRAEIREGRETLKDLRGAIKEARGVAPRIVTDLLTAEVTTQLKVLSDHTKRAMDDSVARVIAKFDDLFRAITGQDHTARRAGKPSIPDLIAQRSAETKD
ncbi:hypothetical protein KMT30_05935 [Streptomyces sp. IBSBF 2953]|nr:hypothetical protein [Streptomyces hayashii]